MKVCKLEEGEVALLFKPLRGSGGWQGFLLKLQSQFDHATGEIVLFQDDLQKLPDMTAMGNGNGGFQSRLRKIFARSLGADRK